MAQESIDYFIQMAKDYAKAKKDLEVQHWVFISSLDSYFGKCDDERIIDDISQEGYVSRTGEDYPLLRINDLLDDNAMLEFAVIGQQYDVLKLSFLGRKG